MFKSFLSFEVKVIRVSFLDLTKLGFKVEDKGVGVVEFFGETLIFSDLDEICLNLGNDK